MHPVLVRGTRAALTTAALAFPVVAGAQQAPAPAPAPQAGAVEFGVFGQYNLLKKSTTDFTSNTPTSLGLRANIAIGGGLGLEFEGSRAGTTRPARPGLVDRDASYSQLAARATFTSTPIVGRSALVFGAGVVRSDYDYTFRYGPTGMLGLRVPVGQRFVLRGDGIVNLLPSTGDTEVGFRLGLHTVVAPQAGSTAADKATGNRTVMGPGAIELGGFLAFTRHAVDWNIKNTGLVGGRVGVAMTSRSQLEFEFGWAENRSKDESLIGEVVRPNDGTDRNYTPLTLRYNYNVPLGKATGVIVGLGVVRADYGYTHNWGPSGLVGYRVPAIGPFQVRGDLVANYLPAANATDLSARLGLSWVINQGK
ncbi:MAG: hypothetical protein MUF40_01235 [Gemmatimonadaceae bacterium]|jgi:hypothetical protein|nr:hypothetical protein [Gemmatimonadaceae bacterium]